MVSARKSEAEQRFADARRELDEGWTALETGKSELASRREEARQGFAEAQAELARRAEEDKKIQASEVEDGEKKDPEKDKGAEE